MASVPSGDDVLLAHLEDVQGPLEWVRAQNAVSEGLLSSSDMFEGLWADAKAVLSLKDQLPRADRLVRHGRHLHTFIENGEFPRGVWRRCAAAPEGQALGEAAWEQLLDVGALGRSEGTSWVLSGLPEMLGDRALVELSVGGADAVVVREFDMAARAFLPAGSADAFHVPREAKTRITFQDHDTVLVATDWGEGSLTSSGYPRVLKRWRRGQPLAEAETLFEAGPNDVSVFGYAQRRPGAPTVVVVGRSITFRTTEQFVVPQVGPRRRLPTPETAIVSLWGDRVVVQLRHDWHGWAAGSLVAGPLEAFLERGAEALRPVFVPTPTRVLEHHCCTRDTLVCLVLDNVVASVEEVRWDGQAWVASAVATPSPGSMDLRTAWDPDEPEDRASAFDALQDSYLLWYRDFLTPTTIFQARTGRPGLAVLQRMEPRFDASGGRTVQHMAESADGTRVPYFLTLPAAAGGGAEGPRPCLLYVYGGFEVSETPFYSGVFGRLWLAHGGALVLANVRGGGEYGPRWHQAALREHRQRCYDDVAAVARDVVARGVTTPAQLGLEGGSNGGLTVAACMLQQPHLYGAVVSQCPLLDMHRYHLLHAGRSWVDEYGDPDDPEQWAFLSRYSPLHNVRPVAEGRLPAILFTSSTRDDRVHPAHSRKMLHRMRQLGHDNAYLYENIEGGHSNAADIDQRARILAYEFSMLWMHLKKKT